MGRLHLVHPAIRVELGRARSCHHLSAGVQDYLQERNSQSKQHPDINHLDIGGDRQALGDPQKPKHMES